MENLPLPVFENILSFLNRIDQSNFAFAFNQDLGALPTVFHRNIELAWDYRFRQSMIPSLITCRADAVKLLDLTGIFWIDKEVILQTCLQLVNLESLYLVGTDVIIDGRNDLQKLQAFEAMQNIKHIAVAVYNCYHRWSVYGNPERTLGNEVNYCFLRRNESRQNTSSFSKFDVLNIITADFEDEEYSHESCPRHSIEYLWNKMKPPESLCEMLESHNYTAIETTFLDETAIITKLLNAELQNRKSLHRKPIGFIENVTILEITVPGKVKDNFLEPVLKACENLNKLKIKCYEKNFSWKHLKYASENLKHLIVSLENDEAFYLNDFVAQIDEAPNLKLQRLYLNYGRNADLESFDSNSNLSRFMSSNPQLTFVYIVSRDSGFQFETISNLLASFKKKEYQWFQCKSVPLHVPLHVPLQHFDMLYSSLNSPQRTFGTCCRYRSLSRKVSRSDPSKLVKLKMCANINYTRSEIFSSANVDRKCPFRWELGRRTVFDTSAWIEHTPTRD